jgi:cholinesterase
MLLSIFNLALCVNGVISGVIENRQILANQPQVTLPGGAVVSGVVDARFTSVRQFLGIPYAEQPVGSLRWEPPKPNKLPSAVNANLLPKSCMQFLGAAPGVYRTEVLQFGIGGGDTSNIGEDCLTLSVWAPDGASNLPVLISFYGGGLNTGGQDVPYQIPTQWVQRTKDLIVVVLK